MPTLSYYENMKTIRIACDTKDSINWHDIKPLQGNYKKRTQEDVEKLCRKIIKRGIRFPSFISRIKGDIWAIDTHGRLLAYEKLEKDGYTVPLIPVVYIDAKDKAEAKQLLLECDSRYGKRDQQGFNEFVDDLVFESDEEMTDFYSDLELADIETEISDSSGFGDPKEAAYKDKIELVIECKDETQAEELYSEFKERGLKCKISTL